MRQMDTKILETNHFPWRRRRLCYSKHLRISLVAHVESHPHERLVYTGTKIPAESALPV